jgi:hypothetical protein
VFRIVNLHIGATEKYRAVTPLDVERVRESSNLEETALAAGSHANVRMTCRESYPVLFLR